jgi:NADH-quinone oxidoreductase subunit F
MRKIKKIKTIKDLEQSIHSQIQARKSEKKPVLIVSAGTCGQARGSLKVIKSLEKAIKEQNLEDKVKIKVTGCHGFCEAEPNIIVQPQNIFYQKVQPKDAKDITFQTIINNKVIDQLLFTDLATGKKVSNEKNIPFYKKQRRII